MFFQTRRCRNCHSTGKREFCPCQGALENTFGAPSNQFPFCLSFRTSRRSFEIYHIPTRKSKFNLFYFIGWVELGCVGLGWVRLGMGWVLSGEFCPCHGALENTFGAPSNQFPFCLSFRTSRRSFIIYHIPTRKSKIH